MPQTMQTVSTLATVMYKRYGRARGRSVRHLLGADGEPVCGRRFNLDDWALAQTPIDSRGSGLCPACRAYWSKTK